MHAKGLLSRPDGRVPAPERWSVGVILSPLSTPCPHLERGRVGRWDPTRERPGDGAWSLHTWILGSHQPRLVGGGHRLDPIPEPEFGDRIRVTWVLTVASPRWSLAAISALLSPRATSWSTSRSRSVSEARSPGSGGHHLPGEALHQPSGDAGSQDGVAGHDHPDRGGQTLG